MGARSEEAAKDTQATPPVELLDRARKLAALSGGRDLRRLAASRLLAELSSEESVRLLHDLCTEAHQRDLPAAQVAMSAFLEALTQESAWQAPALLNAARDGALHEVEALFTQAPPVHALDPQEAARRDARQFTETTLGHLKWKARLTRSPEEIQKLATASESTVVRNLLMNPRLTEEAVVRMAARRPVRPEVLLEVWRSPRWSVRHDVRRALAFNPYLSPQIGTHLVPLLNRTDWLQLSRDASVHLEVRAQAKRLLDQASGGRGGGVTSLTSTEEGVTSTKSAPRDALRNE
jgi:hypothetical protein